LVSTGMVMIGQVRSGYVRLFQFIKCLIRLGQVVQVMSGKAGYVRLGHVRPGEIRLCQVRSG
jgi:hypothetical protein